LWAYIARPLVLAAVKRNVVVLAAKYRENLAVLISAQFGHHVYILRSLVLDAKPWDAVLLAIE
jgi:hypothetical protein